LITHSRSVNMPLGLLAPSCPRGSALSHSRASWDRRHRPPPAF
jgi:hypothetical protein